MPVLVSRLRWAGQISDPVKSQFGWHIIKVEEKRSRKTRPSRSRPRSRPVTRKAQTDVAKLREATHRAHGQTGRNRQDRCQAGCGPRQARRLEDGAGEEVNRLRKQT